MSVRTAFRAAVMGLGLCAPAGRLDAQQLFEARSGFIAPSREVDGPTIGDTVSSRLGRIPLWSAPIASAIIPGLGQARLGQDRFVAYMALEAYLVLEYFKNGHEGDDNAATYRTIARNVARRGFPGTRPDTVWQYYEKMEKYDASGLFSKTLGGPTVPETDVGTYNGLQWVQARQVYGIPLDDPNPSNRSTYAQAVTYYESRAIPLAYAWDWVNANLEKDLFVRTINQSNDAFRRASTDVIVLIANHIVSAVDAFSSVRLVQARAGGFQVRASIPLR